MNLIAIVLSRHSNSLQRLLRVACLFSAVVLGVAWAQPAFGQEGTTGWSQPEVIATSDGKVFSCSAAAVSDETGQLHLFYTDIDLGNGVLGTINYVRWNGSEWSQALDIIADPENPRPACVRAVLDKDQVVHLIWNGANNDLIYQSARLEQISSPMAWSAPLVLAKAFFNADIAVDTDNRLNVVYSDAVSEGTVSMIQSTDGGVSWSNLAPVSAAQSSNVVPADIRLAIDGAGRFHVVWTEAELSEGNPLTGVYYTRSLDGGATWEAPLEIDDNRHGQIGVAAVGNDEIHLVWRSNIAGDGTFHQVSTDGGVTWATNDRFDDGGGMSGLPSFGLDTTGTLHYVIGPVKYANWQAGRLSDYVDVATESVRQTAAMSNGEAAVLAITSGNRVHVFFETDFQNVWYTSKLLDVPALPTATAQPQNTPVSTPTTQPLATSVVGSISPEPRPTVDLSSLPPPVEPASPGKPLILAMIPTLGLLLVVVGMRLVKKSK